MIDYTKLQKKLLPQADGEDTLNLRTAVVSAVNANGTVDITMSGVTVPNVPRLRSAEAVIGQTVQVISFRGALLVLGPSGETNVAGLRTVKTGSVTTGIPGGGTSFSTPVSFGVTFPAAPNVHINLNGSSLGASAQWHFWAINVTTTGFDLFGAGATATFTQPFQWTAVLAP